MRCRTRGNEGRRRRPGTIGLCVFSVLSALLFVTVSGASAGWKLVEEQANVDEKNVIWIEGERVASGSGKDGLRILLVDDAIAMVSDGTKSYYRAGRKEYAKAMCEFRKRVLEMTGYRPEKRPEPKVTVEKLGMTKVAGYKAEGFRVLADGKPFQEIWLNRDPRLKDLDRAWKELRSTGEPDFSSCGLTPQGDERVKVSRAYRKLYGSAFVLKESDVSSTWSFSRDVGGETFSYDTVVSIEKVDVEDSLFEIPRDYRRLSLEEFMEQPSPDEKEPEASPPGGMPGMGGPGMATPPVSVPPMMREEPAPPSRSRPEAAEGSDGGNLEEQRARWGKSEAEQQEEDSGGVEEQIKEGVKGFLKSIF